MSAAAMVVDAVPEAEGTLAASRRARAPRAKDVFAILVSVAFHGAAMAMLLPKEPKVMIAGGEAIEVTVVGDAFLDALMAGEPVEQAEALPVEQAEALTVETAEIVEAEPVTEPVEQPTPPVETVRPLETREATPVAATETPELLSVPALEADPVEAVPPAIVEPAETAALQPMEAEEVVTADEAVEVEEMPELAEAPVPTPRPEYTPPPEPVEKPKRVARETPKAEKPHKVAHAPASKTRRETSAGHGGQARADARAGASGGGGQARQAGNAAVSNYPGQVTRKLRRALRYPREAGRQRLRGEVAVSFVVSRDGNAGSIRVVKSSGSPILDNAALETVRRAAPFPPIPDGRPNWPFTVPLVFTR